MIELDIYAKGVRQMDKILALELELGSVEGLRYRLDNAHDMVYLELETPAVTADGLRSMFRRCDLDPKIVGAIPQELNSRTKTQRLTE
jgi:hypothetical protein